LGTAAKGTVRTNSLCPAPEGVLAQGTALVFPVTLCIRGGAARPLLYWSCTIPQALHGTPK